MKLFYTIRRHPKFLLRERFESQAQKNVYGINFSHEHAVFLIIINRVRSVLLEN